MLCSSCGREVAPVVSVDVDGSLGDYHGHFVRFAEGYLGRKLPRGYGGEMEFSEWLGIDKRTYRDVKLAYRQGGMKRTMPAFDGASWFMNGLRGLGAEIWIATTRPYLRLDNIDPDTRHWLERHDIPYDSIIYGEDKYERLVNLVEPDRIILVVEDLIEEVLVAEGLGLNVLQPERDHNVRSRREDGTFGNFRAALAEVAARLEEWRMGNG
jgi:hypothetical protein